VGTDPHHDTYAYINGAWTELSTTDTPSIYAVVNANMIWGVSRTGAIESWNGAGWTALSPAPSFTTSQAVDALAAGENYLAAIDTSGGIHVLNSAGSGVWSTISGTASSITGGGAFLFTDNSSGAVSHVNLVVPAIEVSASGQWPCPFSVYTCDASAVHTLTATAQFGGKGGLHGPGGISAVASTFMVGPTNPLATANAFETAVLCDPLTNPTAPECQPGGTGDATCSEAGLLQSGGIPSLQFEGALTQAFWLGTPAPACSTGILGTKCIYAVRNDCTAATTPPDLSMAFVNSGNYVGIATYITWMNAALCVRTNAGGPWACFLPLSFINGMNVALPQYSCTYNP
jgi:hypothetical protein